MTVRNKGFSKFILVAFLEFVKYKHTLPNQIDVEVSTYIAMLY